MRLNFVLIGDVFCPYCLETQEVDVKETICPSCGSTIPDGIIDMAKEISYLRFNLKHCRDQLSLYSTESLISGAEK